MATEYKTLVVKRGSAEDWAASTVPLQAGEWGLDQTNQVAKMGDGFSVWADLQSTVNVTADGQLPELTREAMARNLSDPATPEGAAIAELIEYDQDKEMYSTSAGTALLPGVDPGTNRFPDQVRKAQTRTVAVPVGQGEIVWNVLDFGASPDGSQPTATLAAINEAVAAATAAGGSVFFPSGYYVINGSISITKNVTIFGAGEESTTLGLDNGSNVDMFTVATPVVGFNLRSIKLFGNKTNNTAGSGVRFADDPGQNYLGSGRLSQVIFDSFAENGVVLGRHRSTAYLDNIVSGNNAGYGIYLGDDAQDTLILSPNLGKNGLAGLYVNGSNNTVTGGTIYGGPNLIVEGARASKFLCTGTVLEGSDADAIVISTSSSDEVNTHQFIGVTMGHIGVGSPGTSAVIKSATAARVVISGHLYKQAADTAPAYVFDVPAACIVQVAGFAVQTGAFAAKFSKNGTAGFRGYDVGRVSLIASNSPSNYQATTRAFTTMPAPAVAVDTQSGYDTATSFYTIPATGTYSLTGLIRPGDGQVSGTNCAIGVEAVTGDSPTLVWSTGGNRHSMHVSRIGHFVEGDTLRLVYFFDTASPVNVNYANIGVQLVAPD